jgi:hypothetical protein
MLVPNSTICVDDFRAPDAGLTYLLSHVHADHYPGLRAGWRRGERIYCSSETAAVMSRRVPELRGLFHPLSRGEWHTLALTQGGLARVRLIDARHCPGSVMFLLEGAFGRVLYTGDFRVEPAAWLCDEWRAEAACLMTPLEPLDLLLLDNMNQDDERPPREEAEALLLAAMQLYPSDTRFRLGLEFGKEEAAVRAARVLGSPLVVGAGTLADYEALGRKDLLGSMVLAGSEAARTARVAAVSRTEISEQKVASWNDDEQRLEVGVLLRGQAMAGQRAVAFCGRHAPQRLATADELACLRALPAQGLPTMLLVPYALHCCRSELVRFLAAVPHREVRGFSQASQSHPLTVFALGLTDERQRVLDAVSLHAEAALATVGVRRKRELERAAHAASMLKASVLGIKHRRVELQDSESCAAATTRAPARVVKRRVGFMSDGDDEDDEDFEQALAEKQGYNQQSHLRLQQQPRPKQPQEHFEWSRAQDFCAAELLKAHELLAEQPASRAALGNYEMLQAIASLQRRGLSECLARAQLLRRSGRPEST